MPAPTHRFRLLLILSVSLLVGSGCLSDPPPRPPQTKAETEQSESPEELRAALHERIADGVDLASKDDLRPFFESLLPVSRQLEIESFLSKASEDSRYAKAVRKGFPKLLEMEPEWAFESRQATYRLTDGAAMDTDAIFLFGRFPEGWSLVEIGIDEAGRESRRNLEIARVPARLLQLETIGKALTAYAEQHGAFPSDILANDGTPLLSWRVRLLPELGAEELYARFDQSLPWDNPMNRPLLDQIPEVFQTNPESESLTQFLAIEHEDQIVGGADSHGAIPSDRPTPIVITSRGDGVEWTAPSDFKPSKADPLEPLRLRSVPWPVLLSDGRPVLLDPNLGASAAMQVLLGGTSDLLTKHQIPFEVTAVPPGNAASFTPLHPELSLELIGKAVNRYRSEMGYFPRDFTDANGRPTLSWRVRLLSDLGLDGLYREFRLDEPWDSKHNQSLIARIPGVYSVPDLPGQTVYVAPRGSESPFHSNEPFELGSLVTSSDRTGGIVTVTSDHAIEWTRPDGLNLETIPERLATGARSDRFPILMLDGTVRLLDPSASPETVRRLMHTTQRTEIDPRSLLDILPPSVFHPEESPTDKPTPRIPVIAPKPANPS